jgi:hypothetical protein
MGVVNSTKFSLTLGFKSYVLFGTHRGVLSSSCCQHPLPCQPFPPPVLLVATSVRSLSIAGMLPGSGRSYPRKNNARTLQRQLFVLVTLSQTRSTSKLYLAQEKEQGTALQACSPLLVGATQEERQTARALQRQARALQRQLLVLVALSQTSCLARTGRGTEFQLLPTSTSLPTFPTSCALGGHFGLQP